MLNQFSVKNRNVLRKKMEEVFGDRIRDLPVEMQYILLDDLLTAFESRLSMFSQVQSVQMVMDFDLPVKVHRAP